MRPSERLAALILGLLAAALLSACNPYVGRRVADYNAYWCRCADKPADCRVNDGHLAWNYTVSAVAGKPDTFLVKGTIDPSGSSLAGWDRIEWKDTRFIMYVAQKNVIVDAVGFAPRGPDGLNRAMDFEVEFECPTGFDALIFDWQLYLRG